MKKIVVFILPALFLFACGNSNKTDIKNGFSLSGKMTSSANTDLVLSKITTKAVVPIDTVKLTADGEFAFTGEVNAPEFFMLSTSEQNFLQIIVAPGNSLTINADATKLSETFTIEGSEDSKLLKTLNTQLRKTQQSLDELGKEYEVKLSGGADTVATQNEMREKFLAVIDVQKTFTKKFVDANTNSLASLIAISQTIDSQTPILNLEEDKDYFEKVDKALFAAFPTSDAVQSLHKYLQSVEKMAKEEAEASKNNPKIGDIAPEINELSPAGKKIALSSLKGKYVLLDFWASWCSPCRGENPNVVANYNKFKNKNFTIYQVSLDAKADAWKAAIKKDKLGDWYHVSDLKQWSSAPAALYGVRGIPMNFLLDPDGKIIATNLRGNELGKKLAEVLK